MKVRTWWSGFCCDNKEERNLDQSEVNSFDEQVAKNYSKNNGD